MAWPLVLSLHFHFIPLFLLFELCLPVFSQVLGKNSQFLPKDFAHDANREETSKSSIPDQGLLKTVSPWSHRMQGLHTPTTINHWLRVSGDRGRQLSSTLALHVYRKSVCNSPSSLPNKTCKWRRLKSKVHCSWRRSTRKWEMRRKSLGSAPKGLMAFIT